ncbi:MAG: hypothetical protein J6O41_02535, partial [Clostridia bacterium]|nr:hypothetical protein [Clostridia bacterium]
INIENFTFRTNENSSVNIYKPEGEKGNQMFSNSEENKVEKLEYLGDTESNLKELKISNQGGIVVFRCSNDNIAEYKSNEEEEINHSELLKKLNIEEEQIKIEISFDLLISLENGREYKTTISLNLPIEGVVEHGNAAKEITELDEFVFKRVKN